MENLFPSEEEVAILHGGDEVIKLVLICCDYIFLARAAVATLILLMAAEMGPQLYYMSVRLLLRIFFWCGVRRPYYWERVW